jgi:hypothetical protein
MMVNVPGFLEELDVARDDFGERQIEPAPEIWRGGAGGAGNGCGPAFVPNDDVAAFSGRERRIAYIATCSAFEQRARARFAGGMDFFSDAAG